MTIRYSATQITDGIAYTQWHGLGIPRDLIPAGSVLENDIDGTDTAADQFSFRVESYPASGTLTVNDDGSMVFDPAEDGAFVAVVRPRKNNIAEATATSATFISGAVGMLPRSMQFSSAFSRPTLTAVPMTLTPRSTSSASAFSSPAVSATTMALTPGGTSSASAFSRPAVTAVTMALTPRSFVAASSFSRPTVSDASLPALSPSSSQYSRTFSRPAVTAVTMALTPRSTSYAGTFSRPTITEVGVLSVEPADALFGSTFSRPTLTAVPMTLTPRPLSFGSTISRPSVSENLPALSTAAMGFGAGFSRPAVTAVTMALQPRSLVFGHTYRRVTVMDVTAVTAGRIDFAAIKAQTRRIVHDTFSIPALYKQTPSSTGVLLYIRWHNKIARFGNLLDSGYAEVLEGIERVIFDEAELQTKGVTLVRGGSLLCTPPGFAQATLILDTAEPRVGPLNITWLVVKK